MQKGMVKVFTEVWEEYFLRFKVFKTQKPDQFFDAVMGAFLVIFILYSLYGCSN